MGKTKIDVMARDVSSESRVVEEQPSDADATQKLASEVGDLVERLVSMLVSPEPTKPAQLLKAKEVDLPPKNSTKLK
jgi:hypothetical protein